MSRKLDDKELENVSGGTDVFMPDLNLIDPTKLKQPAAGEDPDPDPPIGGSPGPSQESGGTTGIGGDSGSGTFNQG